MQKRFTYWSDDGKRHWTPIIGITLIDTESAKFSQVDKRHSCRLKERAALVERQCMRVADSRQSSTITDSER